MTDKTKHLAILDDRGVLIRVDLVDEASHVDGPRQKALPCATDLPMGRYVLVTGPTGKWRFDPIKVAAEIPIENTTEGQPVMRLVVEALLDLSGHGEIGMERKTALRDWLKSVDAQGSA